MHDEFYSLTGKLKEFKEFIWFFFCRGEGVATRRLPCLRYGSHYLEVEIWHLWDIAKCEPQVLRLEKTLKIGKNIKPP